jgi:hypothetical protein
VPVAADAPDDVGEAAEAAAEIFAVSAAACGARRDDLVVPAVEMRGYAGAAVVAVADVAGRQDHGDTALGAGVEHALRSLEVGVVRRAHVAGSGEGCAADEIARRVTREKMLDQLTMIALKPLARRSSR